MEELQIREWLLGEAEEKYQIFASKLIPGETRLLGVRIPILRKKAKQLAKQDWENACTCLHHCIEKNDCYMEEKLLFGFVIGYAQMPEEQRIKWLDRWVLYIDNWSVCDSGCMTYHFMKKNPKFWWDYLQKWFNSSKEFELRFGIVSLLDHFVTDQYMDDVLAKLASIDHDGYYVKMAVAWAISVCYVFDEEKTSKLLKQQVLDEFTQNKSIQKICESLRVTKEQKQVVRGWKIADGKRHGLKETFIYDSK